MDKNGYVNKTKRINKGGFGSGKHQGALHDTLKGITQGTVWLQDALDPLSMPTYIDGGSGLMYIGNWERDHDTSKVYQKGDYFIMNSGDMKVFNGGGWETLQGTATTNPTVSSSSWQTMPNLDTGTMVSDRSIPHDASVKPYTPRENKFPPVFISVTYPNGDRGVINVNKIIEIKQTQKDTTIEMEDYRTIVIQEVVDVLMAKIIEAKGGTF